MAKRFKRCKKLTAIENSGKNVTDELTEAIIGAAIEVHRLLGPGLLESIYEQALCHELGLRNIGYVRQMAVDVQYKDLVIHGQRLDLLVESLVIVELKSLRTLPESALAQTLSYLKATGLRQALLINFGHKRLIDGIKRISL
ncbi:GxxExxY protein [Sulfuriferula sp. GW1]|uniref:GxxExxY protein n=1 Tax=Sulfuriferula sp. GW1 TaxID=3345111 RepID=UPI0039AFE936